MSFQEKGRVLRLAVSIMGQATKEGSVLPALQTSKCPSLVTSGAGAVA